MNESKISNSRENEKGNFDKLGARSVRARNKHTLMF